MRDRCGLQCLIGLDLLPPNGAMPIAAPFKIRRGLGNPLRVLAQI
jgi:kynurenine formamidase